MVDVQTVTIVIAGISVIIGVLNSILSSRRANQQRQTRLFIELYNQWISPALVSSYGNVRYNQQYQHMGNPDTHQKVVYEPFNEEMWRHFHTLINFFEGVGVLVQKGFIDIKLVENLLSRRIIWSWEHYKLWVQYNRKKSKDPKIFDSLEWLYHRLMQREQQAIVS